MLPSFHSATQAAAVMAMANGLRAISVPVCWPCWEGYACVVVATEEHSGESLCSECYEALAEAAWDRSCEEFYGGSGPVTLAEQMAEGRRNK